MSVRLLLHKCLICFLPVISTRWMYSSELTHWCTDSEGSFGVTWYTAVFFLLHYPLNWFHGLSVSSSPCLLSCYQSVTPAFTFQLVHSFYSILSLLYPIFHLYFWSPSFIPFLLYSLLLNSSLQSQWFVRVQTDSDVFMCVWLCEIIQALCMENWNPPLYWVNKSR